jgi:hypothetical protein
VCSRPGALADGSLETLVKILLKTLLGGFLVFMVLAMAQEWEFFAEAWFGKAETRVELPYEDLVEASDAVRMSLSLMQHFYMSEGDPRFAERMPVAEWVIDEMRQDIAYLSRNHRLQDAALQQMEILSVEALDEDRVEIETREFWTVRMVQSPNGSEADPARSHVAHVSYLLGRTGQGWRVESWGPASPSEPVVEAPTP